MPSPLPLLKIVSRVFQKVKQKSTRSTQEEDLAVVSHLHSQVSL